MIKKIDHIAIMVPDMQEAKRMFGKGLGLEFIKDDQSEEWNSIYSFFQCGDVMLELIQPIGPGSNQDFLNEKGSGIHHICYEADDLEREMEAMKQHFRFEDEEIKTGAFGSRVCFLDPASILNIETELVEKKK